MNESTEERLLRAWLEEPVWLPESDLTPVLAYAHRRRQQRGWLPPIDRADPLAWVGATALVMMLALALVIVVGGYLQARAQVPGPDHDSAPVAHSLASPTDQSEPQSPAPTPATDVATIAPTTPSPPGKVHWEDHGVTFNARTFTIETNGRTFQPKSPISITGSYDQTQDPPAGAKLDADWKDQGRWMRLGFELRSDGSHWWIEHVRAYDGKVNGSWLVFGGLKEETLTPVGQAFEGSLKLRATDGEQKRLIDDARVQIDDMRLRAFDPASIPTPESRIERPRLTIEFEQERLLPRQSQRITAQWCLGDQCWPADDAKWRSDTPNNLKLEPTTGTWTRAIALRPGEADVRVTTQATHYASSFMIRPRAGEGSDRQRYSDARRAEKTVVTPRDKVLQLGQYAVLTAWRCPTKGADQLGPDGEAGTEDDKCRTEEPRSFTLLPGSGLASLGTFGPSTVVVAESFEIADDDVQFAGVLASFDSPAWLVVAEPNLYIRDRRYSGPLLGDLDADDDVDPADLALLETTIDGSDSVIGPGDGGWDAALDLDRDYRLDRVDIEILDALVRAYAGELVPEPAKPFPTDPPEFEGRVVDPAVQHSPVVEGTP